VRGTTRSGRDPDLRALVADALGGRTAERVVAVTLVDPASGLLLDGSDDLAGETPHTSGSGVWDVELAGACHADLWRAAVLGTPARLGGSGELLVGTISPGSGPWHHVLRLTPDAPGGAVLLGVVLRGRRWRAELARRRLRSLPVAALTAALLRDGPAAGRAAGVPAVPLDAAPAGDRRAEAEPAGPAGPRPADGGPASARPSGPRPPAAIAPAPPAPASGATWPARLRTGGGPPAAGTRPVLVRRDERPAPGGRRAE
jgi:hypothetical protein